MPANKIIGLALLCLFSASALADKVALNPRHPDSHTVVKGDTLWDISSRFLRDPWRWPDVWGNNPQIQNPHLIYPGDVIRLTYHNGEPRLVVDRPGQPDRKVPGNVIRLSPQARPSSLALATIPPIPPEAIQPFLDHSVVISERDLEIAPYIAAMEEGRLIAGTGNNIFVRDMMPASTNRFMIFRAGKPYISPDNENEILGYEATYVGEADLTTKGDPSKFKIITSSREALIGDKLTPMTSKFGNLSFVPHAPKVGIEGKIISVVDGVSRIGQYMTVVIDKGELDGMETGHVLAVDQTGATVRDPFKADKDNMVKLPDERAGLIMVYRTFERVSYALVMIADRDLRLNDAVHTP